MTVVIATFIYPVIAHWVWGVSPQTDQTGWLQALSFHDFAGSTVVHSTGGWVALAAILIIGPRIGRFGRDGEYRPIKGSNIALSAVGCVAIFIGWLGFNAGSAGVFYEQTPSILINTIFAGTSGGITVILLCLLRHSKLRPKLIINGILSGLVAITASADLSGSGTAGIIGSIGAIVMLVADWFLKRSRIDDAIGAVAVHLFPGIWGTLAVSFFYQDLAGQLVIQLIGISTVGFYCFTVSYLLLHTLNRYFPLRIDRDGERFGLNLAEHGEGSDVVSLLSEMNRVESAIDPTSRIKVNLFNELGAIASKYNRSRDLLEMSVAQNEAVLKHMSEPVVIFSATDYRILRVNQAMISLIDRPERELIGMPVVQLFAEEGVPERIMGRRIQSLAGKGEASMTFSKSDGTGIARRITVNEVIAADEDIYILVADPV